MSIGIGLVIVVISVVLIRREITRAVQASRLLRQTSKPETMDWWERLQRLEAVQEETNASFYELVAALEERMSMVEGTVGELENAPRTVEAPIEPVVRSREEDPELSEKLRSIRSLEEEGLSEQQIAKRLDMGLGELKLLKHRRSR